MHKSPAVRIGCTDCHGGDATVSVAAGISPQSSEYQGAKQRAHPKPKVLQSGNSANPVRAYTDWLKEDPDYIRFVNPGDLRIASTTCGTSGCHAPEVQKVRTSMMTHGAMLWGAALYNNGAFPMKNASFWGKLLERRSAAAPDHVSAAHAPRKHGSKGSCHFWNRFSAGDLAAGQCAADF